MFRFLSCVYPTPPLCHLVIYIIYIKPLGPAPEYCTKPDSPHLLTPAQSRGERQEQEISGENFYGPYFQAPLV